MKKDKLVLYAAIAAGLLLILTAASSTQTTPLYRAFLQSNMNGNQFAITNLFWLQVKGNAISSVGGTTLSEQFGSGASASGTGAGAFGVSATASGTRVSAFGSDSSASGTDSSAFGENSFVSANRSTCIGVDASSFFDYSTALGQSATVTATHQIMLGTASEVVTIPGLTASTVLKADASKNVASIANAVGTLINDGSGNVGFTAMPTLTNRVAYINANNYSVDGSLGKLTVSSFSPSPYFFVEGYGGPGSSQSSVDVTVPYWVTSVSGSIPIVANSIQASTNHATALIYYQDGTVGRVVGGDLSYCFVMTNGINWFTWTNLTFPANSNALKGLQVLLGPSTNAANRYAVGPMILIYN